MTTPKPIVVLVLLLVTCFLACDGKAVDRPDDTPTSDGGTPDGGTADGGTPDGGTPDGGTPDGGTADGGTSDGGGGVCRYSWGGAPCSSEWEGKHNCSPCEFSYTCQAGSELYPLTWVRATIPCECVDQTTGEILREVKGCEDVGG